MEAWDTRVNGLTIVKPRDVIDAGVRGGGASPCAARNQQVTGGHNDDGARSVGFSAFAPTSTGWHRSGRTERRPEGPEPGPPCLPVSLATASSHPPRDRTHQRSPPGQTCSSGLRDRFGLGVNYFDSADDVLFHFCPRQLRVFRAERLDDPIMIVVPLDVWVTANFKESQIGRMRPGDRVDLGVDAYSSLKLHGHVQSIQYGSGAVFSAFPVENATGNYVKIVQRVPVKIVIDQGLDPNAPLPLGLSVSPVVYLR